MLYTAYSVQSVLSLKMTTEPLGVMATQLLAYISSKLLGKGKVTEEELRGILEKTAQATDMEAQDLLIEVLEKKGIIKDNGDGTWKVL